MDQLSPQVDAAVNADDAARLNSGGGAVRSASQYGNRRGNRHGRPERIMSATTLLPDDDEAIDDLQRKIRTEMAGKKAILDHNAIYATLFLTISMPLFSADNAVHYGDMPLWRQYLLLFAGCGSALCHIVCIFMAVEFNFVYSVLNSVELDYETTATGGLDSVRSSAGDEPVFDQETKVNTAANANTNNAGYHIASPSVRGGTPRDVENPNAAFLQPDPPRSADGKSGMLSTLTVLCHDHEARKMTALLHLKKHPLMISKLGISGHCLFMGIMLSVLCLYVPMAELFDETAGDAALAVMVGSTAMLYMYGIFGIGHYVKNLMKRVHPD